MIFRFSSGVQFSNLFAKNCKEVFSCYIFSV
nr:MAG TPA: hypothetical protein [Caudoviricetes sp.]